MDQAHQQTDRELKQLEKRLAKTYGQAATELQAKFEDYMRRFAIKDEIKRKQVASGELSQEEYIKWRYGQICIGKRWEEMVKTMTEDLVNVDQIAMSMVNDFTPDVYALNHNYGTFEAESGSMIDTSYTLYDRDTVNYLLTEEPDLLPRPKVDIPKDMAWNKKHITSAITQGILQGESIPQISKRLTDTVGMDHRAAVRSARTATTGAENKGRIDSYKRAEKMGIKIKKTWLATLDGRTRHAHRYMDGQKQDTDKPFKSDLGTIMYPGDPHAHPANVYNCFLGDTKIASDSEIVRSYKHKYSGDIITVKTSRGVEFSCTPNHPILTPSGWVAAKFLNDGDDILIALSGNDFTSRVNPDVNHAFPSIEAIHDSIYELGGKRGTATNVNFHGDIPTSNVEVVTQKWFLRKSFNSRIRKSINEFFFKFANSSFAGCGAFLKHFRRIFESSFCNISGVNNVLSFFRRRIGHSDIHRFRTVSAMDTGVSKNTIDNASTESEIISDFLGRFTCEITTDQIISIEVVSSGSTDFHVYNLQTENGYYFVNSSMNQSDQKGNGIFAIAHNCRCTLIAQVQNQDVDASDLSDRNTRKLGGMSYDEWKASKPGPSKAKKKTKPDKPATETAKKAKPQKPKTYPDTFEGKIARIQDRVKANGSASEDDLKEAGKLIAKKRKDDRASRLAQAEMIKKERDKIFDSIMDYPAGSKDRENAIEKWKKLDADCAKSKLNPSKMDNAQDLKQVLSSIREMGSGGQDINKHLGNSKSKVAQSVKDAYDIYPSDWVKKSVDMGNLHPQKVKRGYYNGVTIAISAEGESAFKTAIHELGHRMEDAVPGIKQSEKDFYDRRTKGEELKWLGRPYGKNEKARKDDFINPYMGKDYGGDGYELVSMGFEMAYTRPELLAKDPDMESWIYGILALM